MVMEKAKVEIKKAKKIGKKGSGIWRSVGGIASLILFSLFSFFAVPASRISAGEFINGAGSTFVYPLLGKWSYAYYEATKKYKVNYQSIGSGGGVRQAMERTVDLGATDGPLTPEETKKHNLAQFPIIIGGVVVAYNLPIKEIRLTSEVVCDIFLGKIDKWNHPRIAELNPGVKLPSDKITVVRRSDGSGTTWIFTNYLSKACPEWAEKVGYEKAVNWPVGIGAKGNEGVANYIKRIKGAIGYVEYAYAIENKLNYALVSNKNGKFVAPSIKTFQAAARNAKWDMSKDFYEVLTWQEGDDAYPISGAVFILIPKEYEKERARKVLEFFDWCFENGDKIAESIEYVPLPPDVKKLVRDYWKSLGWW